MSQFQMPNVNSGQQDPWKFSWMQWKPPGSGGQMTPEAAGFQMGPGGRYYQQGDSRTGRTLAQLQGNGYLNQGTMQDQVLGANWRDYQLNEGSNRFNWGRNNQAINEIGSQAKQGAGRIEAAGNQGHDVLMEMSRQVGGQGQPWADSIMGWAKQGVAATDEWARKADATMGQARKEFEDDSAQMASQVGFGNKRAMENQKQRNLADANGAFQQTGDQLQQAQRQTEQDFGDRNTMAQAAAFNQFNQAKANLTTQHANLQAQLAQIQGGASFQAGNMAQGAANTALQFQQLSSSLASQAQATKQSAVALAEQYRAQGLQTLAQLRMQNPFAPTSLFDTLMRGAAVASMPGVGGQSHLQGYSPFTFNS